MKRLFLLVLLLLIATPVLAATVPAKSEMAVSGVFVKPKGGANIYTFEGQLAVPLNAGGNILLGPKLRFDSDDAKTAAGAVFEINLGGTAHSGVYLGANGLYNLKDVAGAQRYTADAVAGLKLKVGSGGFVKIFVSKTVSGRGKDNSDVTGNVGIGIRF